MERTLAFGDIHGCLPEFEALLRKIKFNADSDRVIFMGDLVDKGENPKGVVQRVMELRRNYGVECVGGNHEQIFLNWLDDNDYKLMPYLTQRVGGSFTVKSFAPEFSGDERQARKIIANQYSGEVDFLRGLPDYIETDTHIFVHAGVDPTQEDWRETSKKDFRWIRAPFFGGAPSTEKTVVFGHTPTKFLHQDENNHEVWIKDNKMGIDGGCVYGGLLHCAAFANGRHENYFVNKF